MQNVSRQSTATVFFRNGLTKGASSLLLRFCSMLFNVFLASRSGEEAMGLIALIYSVWGFVLTAGCAGGALASARLSAEADATGEGRHSAEGKCLTYSLVTGALAGVFLFIGATPLSHLLRDGRVIPSLRILALSLPFISMSNSLSGFFDSTTGAYKNSVIQLIEQPIRITVTLLLLSRTPSGATEAVCSAIITGGSVSDVFSFFLLLLMFLFDRSKSVLCAKKSSITIGRIAEITLPVTFSALIRSGLVSIEHMLIPRCLESFGYTKSEALSLFGTVHGMTLPVILFSIAIPSAFSSLLIPNFARNHKGGNKKETEYVALRAYRVSFCFAIGVSAYLALSSEILGNALYPESDTSKYIYSLAPLVPIMYIDSVSDALLKGTGEQMISMKINIIDAALSVGAILFLTPKIGIWGYIVAIYISETFNTVASFICVHRKSGITIGVVRFIFFPLFLSLLSAEITSFFYSVSRMKPGIGLALYGMAVFLILYIALLFLTGNISREERIYIKGILSKSKKSPSVN